MTIRQKLLQAVYPLLMLFNRLMGKTKVLARPKRMVPPASFYDLGAVQNTGVEIPFGTFKNKKVLLVNTASGCGYTAQYAELQTLYERYRENLVVLAFPANDFKDQEPESDAAINQFCTAVYGLSFPLVKKSRVQKGEGQHPVFRWLTDPAQNGWNGHGPDWNFSKYLVNEQGELTHYFGPGVSPLSGPVIRALET